MSTADHLTPEDLATLQAHFDDTAFLKELAVAINRHSRENGSNTPDFVLALYLADCLAAFDKALQHREAWYGRDPQQIPGSAAVARQIADIERREAESLRAQEQARKDREDEDRKALEQAAQAIADSVPAVSDPAIDPGPVAALTMTLGDINTRIAPLKIDQVGLAQLGIKSCGSLKRAVLYRADEWPATRAALIKHLEGC